MSYLRKHAPSGRSRNILLQVNIAKEPQKGGFLPESLESFQSPPFSEDGFVLQGLMCLPPFGHTEVKGPQYFSQTRELRDELAVKWGLKLPELSMGMSGDYEIAIEEGATIIRLGTTLFGSRSEANKD